MLTALAVATHSTPLQGQEAVSAPKEIGVVERLVDSLTAGQEQALTSFDRIGFGEAARETASLDGQRYSLSTQTIVETLYDRAELADPGHGGTNFLAALYRDEASRSAQIAADPEFEELRQAAAEPAQPVRFAPIEALPVETPTSRGQAVDRAILKLSEALAGPHVARIKFALVQHLNLRGNKLRAVERAIARSKSKPEAIRRILADHAPPPQVERALRAILQEVGGSHGSSAAFAISPEIARIMEDLSRASEIPPELARYAIVEDQIPSRADQLRQAHEAGLPGKAERRIDLALARAINGPSGTLGSSGPGPRPSAGDTGNSVPRVGPEGPIPSGSPAGADMPLEFPGVGSNGSGSAGDHGQRYRNYTRQAFEGQSRAYRSAIRSASLGRGVSVGGNVSYEIPSKPLAAWWVLNDADPQFGRLFVRFEDDTVGVSKVLFADSFHSAIGVLAVDGDENTRFVEGELLILMSMDPFRADLGPDVNAKIEVVEQLRERAEREIIAAGQSPEDLVRFLEILSLLGQIETLQQEIPRGVVVHPALVGRELAWSAIRIDFSFNDLDGIELEAAMVNDDRCMPKSIREIDMSGAVTWQFYERDVTIRLGSSLAEGVRELRVDTDGERRPGALFAITIFRASDAPGSTGEMVSRMPELEDRLQPMLDWLSSNHHDFIRLDHFSTAFATLRWLRSKGIEPTIVDVVAPTPALATPDRTLLGRGPLLPQ